MRCQQCSAQELHHRFAFKLHTHFEILRGLPNRIDVTLPVDLLLESAIAVAVLNPRRVRNFANGVGIDAKTDPKNPKLLASYGEVVKLQLQVVNPDAEKKLKVNQENNRLQQTRDSEIQQFIRQSLESLRKQVKEIDRRIAKSVSADLRNARMIEIL